MEERGTLYDMVTQFHGYSPVRRDCGARTDLHDLHKASKGRGGKVLEYGSWRRKIDAGRLAQSGSFYVRPIPSPENKVVFVIAQDFSVWDPMVKGNTARVIIGVDSLGRIDSEMRYTKPETRSVKEGVMYNLVLTGKHWDFEPDGTTVKEVTGPMQWRIDDAPGAAVYLTVDTAARYVKEIRDKSRDPSVKKNADKTLAILKHYQ